ncbi:MAG: hypothetical protein ONB46_24185 [candidate division KSB1 bacterium]|nr:hypothetical protein [candidate division KSB1 bacterium]MDZ7368987.1 hypothetical protein [candidate division KSB1 bacterium]MDZ7406975.1 hypothetical protein [candidate division KSB1 bacterium]
MQRAPYKYLDHYTFEDADLFFGREEETQKMVGEILSTRLLVLFSPSGSGKTSLINAGVRPALEKLGLSDSLCPPRQRADSLRSVGSGCKA